MSRTSGCERDFVLEWESLQEGRRGEERLSALFERERLTLFFRRGEDVFGSSEDGRIAFASIKSGGDEKDAPEDPTFTALNLSKLVKGEIHFHVFDKRASRSAKVLDPDEVLKDLREKTKSFNIPDVIPPLAGSPQVGGER